MNELARGGRPLGQKIHIALVQAVEQLMQGGPCGRRRQRVTIGLDSDRETIGDLHPLP